LSGIYRALLEIRFGPAMPRLGVLNLEHWVADGLMAAMGAMNLFGMRRLWPYLIGFAALWFAMLASGIHPTIAGVLAALTIPLGRDEAHSPLKRLEHAIHPWVMFGVVPLFGFVSAGVAIGDVSLVQPLPLAIVVGLFVGKQAGVFGAMWIADRTGIAPRPPHVGWAELYGASVLCGIGFTMSLFIGALAFPTHPAEVEAAKLGTLVGSLVSALAGFAVLRMVGPSPISAEDRSEAGEIFGEDQDEGRVTE
jgi:NhaA family Na+:H+ antiporter